MGVIRKRKTELPDTKPTDVEDEKKVENIPDITKQFDNNNDEESLARKCFEYFKVFLKISVLLLIAPGLINFAALIREEKELKPEGFMVDIRNGQKLFKTCLGKGTPTVLFEAPLGTTSDVWFYIFNEVAKVTKVCAYDRAGLGFSDRSLRDLNATKHAAQPYTVESSVEDFQKLFETEEKPYLLVGSDHGASIMKFYTQLFPDSVASVVFINAMYDGLFLGNGNPWNGYWYRSVMGSLQFKQISSFTGLTRIGLRTGLIKEPFSFKNVPDMIKLRQKYLLCSPGHISSVIEEYYHVNESLAQIRTLKKLRSFPKDVNVTLIFSDKYDENIAVDKNQVWLKSQELLQKEFHKDSIDVIRFKGSFAKLFFTAPKKIAKVIKDKISAWKKTKSLKF